MTRLARSGRLRVGAAVVAVAAVVAAGTTSMIENAGSSAAFAHTPEVFAPSPQGRLPFPQAPGNGVCPRTAADVHGWGAPSREWGFDSPAELDRWWLYDGTGHAGNGVRTPKAISVADGTVVIAGDDWGNTGGMAAKGPGQVHGRWEVCARSSPVTDTYHAVLLLWPDAENWPVGGEIDFMEIIDPARNDVEVNFHYGPDDTFQTGVVGIDATGWHAWAVEWTPDRIAVFVDGNQWWETRDTAHFPPGPMHLAMQLDDFGGDTTGGGQLVVGWAREYRFNG
ncbi:MAG: glycoside hydrolase family 16 protein [Mycobacterium sp.]